MTEPAEGRTFITALNRNLTDAEALAGALPVNLRSAASVYSIAQADALLDTKEPDITAGTSADIWQGDKTWITKAGLPISTATQTALDLKLTTTDLTGAAVATAAVTSLFALSGSDLKRLDVAFNPNVSSTNRFGMLNGGGIFLHENKSAEPTDNVGFALRLQSELTYTGGTPGDVVSLHWTKATVSAGVADYVWAGLDIVDSSATGGQNVARYMQGLKRAVGPVWGAVAEARDLSYSGGVGALGSLVGMEIDVFANGTDVGSSRVGLDIVVGKGIDAEPAPNAARAIRIGPVNGSALNGTFSNGLELTGTITQGIEIVSTGTTGIRFGAASVHVLGVNFSLGTFSGAPIRLAAEQKIQLEATGAITIGYEASGTKFAVKSGATERLAINTSTGAISIAGSQVLAARKTGWGTPSGTLSRAAYASYAGQDVSVAYVEAEAQATDDAVKLLSQTVTALLTEVHSATSGMGFIGT
jgi:hypothetical protein